MKPLNTVIAGIKIVVSYDTDRLSRFRMEVTDCRSSIVLAKVCRRVISVPALAFLLSFFCITLNATTIVAIWSGDRVVLAADSNDTFDGGLQKVCKIIESTGIIFALDGIVSGSRYYWLGNFPDIANATIGRTSIIARPEFRVTAVIDALWVQISEIVESHRVSKDAEYSRWLVGDPLVQGTFIAPGNPPQVLTFSFTLSKTGEFKIPEVQNLNREWPVGSIGGIINGVGRNGGLPVLEGLIRNAGMVQAARQFIEVIIDAFKDTPSPVVGPPIAILEVNGSSASWIDPCKYPPLHEQYPPLHEPAFEPMLMMIRDIHK